MNISVHYVIFLEICFQSLHLKRPFELDEKIVHTLRFSKLSKMCFQTTFQIFIKIYLFISFHNAYTKDISVCIIRFPK